MSPGISTPCMEWATASCRNVPHALVRAASRLVSMLGFELSSHTNKCRDESRHGTQECVRYEVQWPNESPDRNSRCTAGHRLRAAAGDTQETRGRCVSRSCGHG